MKNTLLTYGIAFLLYSCTSTPSNEVLTMSGLNPTRFEKTLDNNKSTKLYTLRNSTGMEVCITNFGARIVSIMVPDKNGNMTDVVLGFDNIEDYIQIPTDLEHPSDAMPTASDKEKSPLMVKKYNCLKIITDIACMEVQQAGKTKYSRPIKKMIRQSH